jgi:hypothetical protein
VGHMEDVMDVIFTTHKGRHLDIVEMYYIKKLNRVCKSKMKEKLPQSNIFDVIV